MAFALLFGVMFLVLQGGGNGSGAPVPHKIHIPQIIRKPLQMWTGKIFPWSQKNESVNAFQLACLNALHPIGDMFRLISAADWWLLEMFLKIMWSHFSLLAMNRERRMDIEKQVTNVFELIKKKKKDLSVLKYKAKLCHLLQKEKNNSRSECKKQKANYTYAYGVHSLGLRELTPSCPVGLGHAIYILLFRKWWKRNGLSAITKCQIQTIWWEGNWMKKIAVISRFNMLDSLRHTIKCTFS